MKLSHEKKGLTDMAESIATLVRSRENSVSDTDFEGRKRDKQKTLTFIVSRV